MAPLTLFSIMIGLLPAGAAAAEFSPELHEAIPVGTLEDAPKVAPKAVPPAPRRSQEKPEEYLPPPSLPTTVRDSDGKAIGLIQQSWDGSALKTRRIRSNPSAALAPPLETQANNGGHEYRRPLAPYPMYECPPPNNEERRQQRELILARRRQGLR